jgi:nitroreductase
MSKLDGTLQLRGEVTPLMKLLLQRRSCRRYAEGSASAEQVAALLATVRRFQERTGFSAPRIAIVEGEAMRAVVKAALGGVIGKINPWLPFTQARHLVLCGARCPEEPAGRARAIKEAAMTMQVLVLAATELGLGTCWMAGINHERVESAFPLEGGGELIAISPLGLPPEKRGLSWDSLIYHLTSKRRKPLAELWMAERWGGER